LYRSFEKADLFLTGEKGRGKGIIISYGGIHASVDTAWELQGGKDLSNFKTQSSFITFPYYFSLLKSRFPRSPQTKIFCLRNVNTFEMTFLLGLRNKFGANIFGVKYVYRLIIPFFVLLFFNIVGPMRRRVICDAIYQKPK
jgi:hypothetical protein